MKKLCTTIMTCTIALTLPITSAIAAAIPKNEQAITHQYHISVNNKAINMHSKEISHVAMVPARAVFDALGFTIQWDGKEKTFHAENGERETDFKIGIDSFIVYSTQSFGMTAPTTLGAAPVIIGGTTYVPVDLFRMIFGNNENAVVVKAGNINIHGDSVDNSFEKKNIGLPAPFVKYDNLADARKAMDVDFAVPSSLPKNFKLDDIFVFNDLKMVQIIYVNGNDRLTYRVSKNSGDISGDYNKYETTKTVIMKELKVTLKGNKGLVSVASWESNGFNYCLMVDSALSFEVIQTIIESIK